MCSDSMISTDWTGAEHGYKMVPLEHNFMALTAGPVDRIRELIELYRKSMAEVMPMAFTKAKALECFRKPLGQLKRRLAEAHLQARIGIGYDDFLREGQNQLPPDLFSELFRDIHAFTSGVELIIVGCFGNPALGIFNSDYGPIIYRVSGDTVSEVDHFACIGAGAVIAESSLYNREHASHNPIDETLYAVYEAKRLGEKAPGVGRKTMMSVMQWPKGGAELTVISIVSPEKLDRHFMRLSPQKITFDEPLLNKEDIVDLNAMFGPLIKKKLAAKAGVPRKKRG